MFILQIAGRIIRVDHVEEYKVPKMRENMDEDRMKLALEGCAPKPIILESSDVSDYEDNKTKHQKKSKSYSFKKRVICL